MRQAFVTKQALKTPVSQVYINSPNQAHTAGDMCIAASTAVTFSLFLCLHMQQYDGQSIKVACLLLCSAALPTSSPMAAKAATAKGVDAVSAGKGSAAAITAGSGA